MSEPLLVIMAAGLGSRFGGPKQLEPVGSHGEVLMDYALYDAVQAGFKRVVFVLRQELEQAFRRAVGDRVSAMAETRYVYQEVDVLPPDFDVPQGRIKPWGTGHALLCAWEYLDAPFAVVEAGGYYGPRAFRLLYGYLRDSVPREGAHHCMAGYLLENTLADQGQAARGICTTSPQGLLREMTLHTHVERRGRAVQYTQDGGNTWATIPRGSLVSAGLWGFAPTLMPHLADGFARFMEEDFRQDPQNAEFLLTSAVEALVRREEATVQVLPSPDPWYGLVCKADKAPVAVALADLRRRGVYPERLWPARGQR